MSLRAVCARRPDSQSKRSRWTSQTIQAARYEGHGGSPGCEEMMANVQTGVFDVTEGQPLNIQTA